MQIDPRGPRFGAVVTTVVLAIVIVTGSAWLLAAQALIFALGAAQASRTAGSTSGSSGRGWARPASWKTPRRHGSRKAWAWPSPLGA